MDDLTEPADLDPSAEPLFPGDTGTLDTACRDALVTLLKRRFISADSHPEAWRTLLANRPLIESRLHELYIELRIDTELETAFKVQAGAYGVDRDNPSLLDRHPWPLIQGALLIHLRELHRATRGATFDPVHVDHEDLIAHAATYLPADDRDEAGARRRATKAIQRLYDLGLLASTREAGRYRIHPIIESFLPVDEIRRIAATLATGDVTVDDTDDTNPGQDSAA